MYLVDEGNNRIRKVTISTGIISTIAGNGGAGSYSGDNGVATSAALDPWGLALDSAGTSSHSVFPCLCVLTSLPSLGNVYIADAGNNRIRKVTVATTSSLTVTPTTIPTRPPTVMPSTPTVIPTSYPSFSPSSNVITTLAGTGATSYSGDGGASTSASFNYPFGISLDSSGK